VGTAGRSDHVGELFTARTFTPAHPGPTGDDLYGDATLIKLRYRKGGKLYGHTVLVMAEDRAPARRVAFSARIREAARVVAAEVGVPVEYSLCAGSDTEWRLLAGVPGTLRDDGDPVITSLATPRNITPAKEN